MLPYSHDIEIRDLETDELRKLASAQIEVEDVRELLAEEWPELNGKIPSGIWMSSKRWGVNVDCLSREAAIFLDSLDDLDRLLEEQKDLASWVIEDREAVSWFFGDDYDQSGMSRSDFA